MSEERESHEQQQPVYGYPNQQQAAFYPAQQPYGFYPMNMMRQMPQQQFTGDQGMLPLQQSYIENILRLNRGKLANVYMTFEGNNQRTFTGIIEAAGRDHIILSEEGTGRRVLLLMVYLDYVTFNEEIEYAYPSFQGSQQLSSYQPR
jgi:spore germination protein Q